MGTALVLFPTLCLELQTEIIIDWKKGNWLNATCIRHTVPLNTYYGFSLCWDKNGDLNGRLAQIKYQSQAIGSKLITFVSPMYLVIFHISQRSKHIT